MRLDVTRAEAHQLLNELTAALGSPLAKPFRVPLWMRLKDKWVLWKLRKQPLFTAEEAERIINNPWGGP